MLKYDATYFRKATPTPLDIVIFISHMDVVIIFCFVFVLKSMYHLLPKDIKRNFSGISVIRRARGGIVSILQVPVWT